MTDLLDDSTTVTLSAEWEHRDGAVISWRLSSLDQRAPAPAGARVILDLTDVPASTAEVVNAVRRLTGLAESVHVIGGARPATRALLVADLLAVGAGNTHARRQWLGKRSGTAEEPRDGDLSAEEFGPLLTWEAGIAMSDRDDEDLETPGHDGEDVDLGGPE